MHIISFTSLSECFFPVLLFVCFCFYWNPLNSQWDNKLPEWTSGPGSWWGKKETISFLYISFCAEIRFYFKEMQTIPDMLRHNETTWDISVSGLVRDARCWNMEEWIKLCSLLMILMQQITWACVWGRKGNRCANYPGYSQSIRVAAEAWHCSGPGLRRWWPNNFLPPVISNTCTSLNSTIGLNLL